MRQRAESYGLANCPDWSLRRKVVVTLIVADRQVPRLNGLAEESAIAFCRIEMPWVEIKVRSVGHGEPVDYRGAERDLNSLYGVDRGSRKYTHFLTNID